MPKFMPNVKEIGKKNVAVIGKLNKQKRYPSISLKQFNKITYIISTYSKMKSINTRT